MYVSVQCTGRRPSRVGNFHSTFRGAGRALETSQTTDLVFSVASPDVALEPGGLSLGPIYRKIDAITI